MHQFLFQSVFADWTKYTFSLGNVNYTFEKSRNSFCKVVYMLYFTLDKMPAWILLFKQFSWPNYINTRSVLNVHVYVNCKSGTEPILWRVETIFPGYATNHSSIFQKNSLMTISPVSWQGQLVRAGCTGIADARVRFPTSRNFFTHSFRNSINGISPELRWSSLCLSTTYNNVCLYAVVVVFFKRKKKTKTSTVFDHAIYIRRKCVNP